MNPEKMSERKNNLKKFLQQFKQKNPLPDPMRNQSLVEVIEERKERKYQMPMPQLSISFKSASKIPQNDQNASKRQQPQTIKSQAKNSRQIKQDCFPMNELFQTKEINEKVSDEGKGVSKMQQNNSNKLKRQESQTIKSQVKSPQVVSQNRLQMNELKSQTIKETKEEVLVEDKGSIVSSIPSVEGRRQFNFRKVSFEHKVRFDDSKNDKKKAQEEANNNQSISQIKEEKLKMVEISQPYEKMKGLKQGQEIEPLPKYFSQAQQYKETSKQVDLFQQLLKGLPNSKQPLMRNYENTSKKLLDNKEICKIEEDKNQETDA